MGFGCFHLFSWCVCLIVFIVFVIEHNEYVSRFIYYRGKFVVHENGLVIGFIASKWLLFMVVVLD